MVHAFHVIHALHVRHASHPGHGLVKIGLRHIRSGVLFPLADEQAAVPGAVLRGSPQFPGTALRWHFDQKVVGFGNGDEETPSRNGLHVRAIGGDDLHVASCVVDVKIAGRARIDQAHAHGFTRSRRKLAGRFSIRQKGVISHVGEVHRRHPAHRAFEHVCPGVAANSPENALCGAFLDLLPLTGCTELCENVMGALVGPVGQHRHEIMIGFDALASLGGDDDAAVNAKLLLQTAVRVIPERAAMPQSETILASLSRFDRGHVYMRYAVLIVWQQNSMPMDGGFLLQIIMHTQHRIIAHGETQCRPWNRAIDRHCLPLFAVEVHRRLGQCQIISHCFCGEPCGGNKEHRRCEQVGEKGSCHAGIYSRLEEGATWHLLS